MIVLRSISWSEIKFNVQPPFPRFCRVMFSPTLSHLTNITPSLHYWKAKQQYTVKLSEHETSANPGESIYWNNLHKHKDMLMELRCDLFINELGWHTVWFGRCDNAEENMSLPKLAMVLTGSRTFNLTSLQEILLNTLSCWNWIRPLCQERKSSLMCFQCPNENAHEGMCQL